MSSFDQGKPAAQVQLAGCWPLAAFTLCQGACSLQFGELSYRFAEVTSSSGDLAEPCKDPSPLCPQPLAFRFLSQSGQSGRAPTPASLPRGRLEGTCGAPRTAPFTGRKHPCLGSLPPPPIAICLLWLCRSPAPRKAVKGTQTATEVGWPPLETRAPGGAIAAVGHTPAEIWPRHLRTSRPTSCHRRFSSARTLSTSACEDTIFLKK